MICASCCLARRTGVFANRLLVGVALDDISIETLELWSSHEWQSFMPGVLCATKAAVASAAVSAAAKVHIDMGHTCVVHEDKSMCVANLTSHI